MSSMSETAKKIVEHLGYPYQIFPGKTRYGEIVDAYEAALEGDKTE